MKYSTSDFFRASSETAEHFGFRTVDKLKRDPACKECNALTHSVNPAEMFADGHGAIWANALADFCEQNLHAIKTPVLLYSVAQQDDGSDVALSRTIFNVQKSIAESLLIQASRSILRELGQDEHLVRVNSLGDSESSGRYIKELTGFLRKRLDQLPEDARERMKEHPILALLSLIKSEHELAYKSPNPLEFLSDQSRKHFREIVEFLDLSEAPYEIDPKMLAPYDFYSDALFSVEHSASADDASTLSVRGGRFDEFVFRKTRQRIPAAGALITLKDSKSVSRVPRLKTPEPAVYVVQLGAGPKMRSLLIIDELRRAGIPVMHDVACDSLSTQLREAEARGIRYTIIVGQKEFVEGSVILRDMHERSQENIPIDQMVKRLKRQSTQLARQ